MLLSLAGMVQSADAAPTAQESAIYTSIAPRVDAQVGRLRALEGQQLAAFNTLMKDLNVPAIAVTESPSPAIVP